MHSDAKVLACHRGWQFSSAARFDHALKQSCAQLTTLQNTTKWRGIAKRAIKVTPSDESKHRNSIKRHAPKLCR